MVTIDYTKYRKGTRVGNRKIEVCPRCGRKGLISAYEDGSKLVTHKGETAIGGAFLSVTDKCFIANIAPVAGAK